MTIIIKKKYQKMSDKIKCSNLQNREIEKKKEWTADTISNSIMLTVNPSGAH